MPNTTQTAAGGRRFTPSSLHAQYQQTLRNFRSDPESWQRFLDTSARMYKYDFESQVLIYNQRPNATACADRPFWKSGRTGVSIAAHKVSAWYRERRTDAKACAICSI